MKYMMIAATLALATSAVAGPTCAPSNRMPTQNYPGAQAINPSNNLMLPAGKAVEAEGQRISIVGKVVDKNCVPVVDAVVELWQQTPRGKWILASDADLAGVEPTFTGAGRTYTNIDGEFTFITAFPAPVGKRAPFVNIKIERQDVSDFSTALYFAGDERNDADGVFKKLSEKTRKDVSIVVDEDAQGQLVGRIEITLPSVVPYRTY